MKSSGISLRNSLLCLQHPGTIFSIIILMLNDHFFKITNPSWLTGKLSDLAGLFFFPFILSTLISLILVKKKWISSWKIGFFAFGSTAIGFILLKTVPFANLWADRIASGLMGRPVRYVLDPTDLLALIALWPAWKLWDKPKKTSLNRFAYIALSMGSFAALATSPAAPTLYNITDVSYSNTVFYAADDSYFLSDSFPVVSSQDGGVTWKLSTGNMEIIDPRLYLLEQCENIVFYEFNWECYRIRGDRSFEYSLRTSEDETASWQSVFSTGDLRIKTYDMVIAPWDGKKVILVAIGKSGILRRVIPDGNWDIIKIESTGSKDILPSD